MVALWQDLISQLSHLSVEMPTTDAGLAGVLPKLHLGSLAALDPAGNDRTLGNCFIPLYDFTDSDAEVLHRGQDVEAVRYVLRQKGILQYFYPAPDQLILGFLDRGLDRSTSLIELVNTAPAIGHPLGQSEMVPPETRLSHIVEALMERKLIVEGEIGLELSGQGQATRGTVRFRPREGIFEKIARILSVKVDFNLKDLFRP